MIEGARDIVCDTGPIIHLDELGCLELLADFKEILLTVSVVEEIEKHRPVALTVKLPFRVLRALYQRKKGRDLCDLWFALTSLEVDDEKVVACFGRYLEHDGLAVSRAEFEGNLNGKLRNRCAITSVGSMCYRNIPLVLPFPSESG